MPSENSSQLRGHLLVILAATLWASQGVFYTFIRTTYGLPSTTAAFFRAAMTAILVFGWMALRGQRILALSRRDVGFFALFGVFGVTTLYVTFANAVDISGVAIATILLYTAPVWVTVISALFLGENWTTRKALSLGLVITGVILVSRAYDTALLQLNWLGVLMGLGSGLGYALYTLFSKVGLRRHEPIPMLGYDLSFGALAMLPFQQGDLLRSTVSNPALLFWLLILTLTSTLTAGAAFISAMRYLPASNASITATLEPVIALFLGAILLHEVVTVLQIAGAGLVLCAVLLLNLPTNKKRPVQG